MTQSASPNCGHDKLNYIWFGDIPRPICSFIFQYDWSLSMQVQSPGDGISDFYFTLLCSRSLAESKHNAHGCHISASGADVDSLDYSDFKIEFDTESIYDEYDKDYMLVSLSHNHSPQEFNPSEALDMAKRDQQVVLFHG
ncbi:hypothetical protein ACLB2K_029739 [Fragaria x ananassa]